LHGGKERVTRERIEAGYFGGGRNSTAATSTTKRGVFRMTSSTQLRSLSFTWCFVRFANMEVQYLKLQAALTLSGKPSWPGRARGLTVAPLGMGPRLDLGPRQGCDAGCT
jgi:hypothetical protein